MISTLKKYEFSDEELKIINKISKNLKKNVIKNNMQSENVTMRSLANLLKNTDEAKILLYTFKRILELRAVIHLTTIPEIKNNILTQMNVFKDKDKKLLNQLNHLYNFNDEDDLIMTQYNNRSIKNNKFEPLKYEDLYNNLLAETEQKKINNNIY